MSATSDAIGPAGLSAEDDSGWLLYHSVGRYPGQPAAIAAALAAAAEAWCALDDRRWDVLGAGRAQFLAAAAHLLHAPPHTIFAAENVTTAFAAFIDALPSDRLRGRRVLIAADCFPSLHYLLSGLAERGGFELLTIAPAAGHPSVQDEDMLAAWDERVALAVITWVTSTASRRADLPKLIAHGRRMGSLVAVDATQGLGILPFDVQALGVDFAATTSLKWLCGVPGAGFGYVAPALLNETAPRLRGWFSKPDPFDWALDSFQYAPDARRFDTGTPSYLPYLASLPGITWLLRTGVDALRAANLAISERLIEVARAHDVAVASPLDPARRGGSVMLELPPAVAAADAVRMLAAHRLFADHRGQRLRLSPGPCTTMDAVARFDQALRDVLRAGTRSAARPHDAAPTPIYRDYDRATFEAQFRLDMIADIDAVVRRRAAAASAAKRDFACRAGLRYADGDGRTLDLYPSGAATPAPLLVFIHGGFWRMMDAAAFAFLAPGFVPFGASLAVIDYPLMPAVRLDELVSACASALVWLHEHAETLGVDPGRIHVSGNSAGGHLVAEMLCGEFAPRAGLIAGGCAVSGLFDLAPVQMSAQNEFLALTDAEVRRFSPLHRPLRPSVPLIAAVGGDEAPEFLLQTAEFAAAWRGAGGDAEHMVVPGADHITVVLDALANPDAALNRAVRRQMGVGHHPRTP